MDAKINRGILTVPVRVDGPQAGPKNTAAAMQYKWNERKFTLLGNPKKNLWNSN